MKKYLIILVTVFAGLIVVASAQAQFGLQKLKNDVTRMENRASLSAQNQEKRLENIKERADRMIKNRINELNRLLQRIQNDKRLSSDDKASLSSDIQADINGLTTLKSKIDADPDAATARNDAKQIITGYYIYKIFVPKMQLLITIDNLQKLTLNLQGLIPQIQNLINTSKSQGKDVSKLQSLLDDINSRLTTIGTALANDKTIIQGVSVNTTNPQTIFTQIRKDLANVRANFAQIRYDIGIVRVEFRTIILTPTP